MKIRTMTGRLVFIECDTLDVQEALGKIHVHAEISTHSGLPTIWGDERLLYKILVLLPLFYNVFLVR